MDVALVRIGQRIAYLFLACAVYPSALASVLALFAEHFWLADLAVNFRFQFLAIGLLGMAGMLTLRRFLGASAAMLAIVLNLAPVWRYLDTDQTIAMASGSSATARPIRIASANVFAGNRDAGAVARWIAAHDADVVILVEASARWIDALAQEGIQYPHSHLEALPGQSGKLVLSRWPIDAMRRVPAYGGRTATPMLRIVRGGRSLWVAAVHTMWPVLPGAAELRNHELHALGEAAAQIDEPWVAAGDFNVTPFSPHFQRMLASGGLRDAAAGHGWMPTWPVFLPWAGIQIDHALVNRKVGVQALAVGEGIGSDHRWLVVDLVY